MAYLPCNDIPRVDVIFYSLRIATLRGGVYAFIDLPINIITKKSIYEMHEQRNPERLPRNNNYIRGQRKDQHPRSRMIVRGLN